MALPCIEPRTSKKKYKMVKSLSQLKVKIFADGANIDSIKSMSKLSYIKGFTTNPTLMKKSNIKDYKDFALEALKIVQNKPISFEVFADEIDEMENQAREINSWGKNIFIKIPVTNTKGESTANLISKLSNSGILCNVTAIFTKEQIFKIIEKINIDSKMILSVFAGRIADSGIDPVPVMQDIIYTLRDYKNIELLWASPRELLNIFQADQVGCHIITVADDLLKKLNNIGKDLNEFSLETVSMFYNDAQAAGYKINSNLTNKKNFN